MTTSAPTKQSVASIVRQVIAVAASIYGVLSASIGQLHLPPAVSAILTAAGPVILAVEHFVSDPSTGTGAALVGAVATEPDAARVEAIVRAELGRLAASLAATPAATPAATTVPVAK
jgi:hypothetical protein